MDEKRICPQCGKEFTPDSWQHKYCSPLCGKRWRKEHNGKGAPWPEITFECSFCGSPVFSGGDDKRSRFCSAQCEKKFWRHPPWESTSTRTNFSSVSKLKSYEKRTNREWSGA